MQRTIDKLLEKEFLSIAVPSDSHHGTPTTYGILPGETVLARHKDQERLYIARIEPGVSFVRPFSGS